MKSGSPNQAQGALGYLRVNESGNNRALVRFDQAAIASAVGTGTLTAAFLELDLVDNANNWSADGRAVDVHRLTNGAWTETGATWNCALDSNPSNNSADRAPHPDPLPALRGEGAWRRSSRPDVFRA